MGTPGETDRPATKQIRNWRGGRGVEPPRGEGLLSLLSLSLPFGVNTRLIFFLTLRQRFEKEDRKGCCSRRKGSFKTRGRHLALKTTHKSRREEGLYHDVGFTPLLFREEVQVNVVPSQQVPFLVSSRPSSLLLPRWEDSHAKYVEKSVQKKDTSRPRLLSANRNNRVAVMVAPPHSTSQEEPRLRRPEHTPPPLSPAALPASPPTPGRSSEDDREQGGSNHERASPLSSIRAAATR